MMMFCVKILSTPGCSSFSHATMGHTHLLNDEICNFWEPDRCTSVFFSCRMPENSARKASHGELSHQLFDLKKKPTFEPSAKVIKQFVLPLLCIYRLYLPL